MEGTPDAFRDANHGASGVCYFIQLFCQGGNLGLPWVRFLRLFVGWWMLLADTALAGRFECRLRIARNPEMPQREPFRRAKRADESRLTADRQLSNGW